MKALKIPPVLLVLVLASACGAHPRPAPNDEVSSPMNVEDEAAVTEAPGSPGSDAGSSDAEPSGADE